MLFSVIFEALIASAVAFIIAYVLLFVFGNVFFGREKIFWGFNEIIKEIQNIISEEKE